MTSLYLNTPQQYTKAKFSIYYEIFSCVFCHYLSVLKRSPTLFTIYYISHVYFDTTSLYLNVAHQYKHSTIYYENFSCVFCHYLSVLKGSSTVFTIYYISNVHFDTTSLYLKKLPTSKYIPLCIMNISHFDTTPLSKFLSFMRVFTRMYQHMSRGMRFPTMLYVRPAKPQTSLRIRAV